MKIKHNKLYLGSYDSTALVRRYGSPLYIYERSCIQDRCQTLTQTFPFVSWYYACKANTNEEVLKTILRQGFKGEAVSRGEIQALRRAGFSKAAISFTSGNVDPAEFTYAVRNAGRVHADSLMQLEYLITAAGCREVSLRLNQGIGAGHHAHVITGGPNSKFGIDITDLPRALSLARRHGVKVTGLLQHIGSNILDPKIFLKATQVLFVTALQLPHLKFLDFGGGVGVPYRPGERELPLSVVTRGLTQQYEEFCARYGKRVEISMEPGRFLVADAGTLLVSVTDIKTNPSQTFVGVNSGFNHLVRPAMYDSYHPIVNASRMRGPQKKYTIAGYLCESGDVFARQRLLTTPRVGDILAIQKAGAYGYVMASQYNLRLLPKEIVV